LVYQLFNHIKSSIEYELSPTNENVIYYLYRLCFSFF